MFRFDLRGSQWAARFSPIVRVLIALAALTTCALAAEKPAGAGTVQGLVVLSPACPGPARIDAAECATRPIQATVDIFVANDRTRASVSVTTDKAGRFQIVLAPGRYLFISRSPRPGITGKPAEVTVRAATVTEITLTLDSGLR